MSYPAISSRRMPYDVDGTEVGYRAASTFDGGIASWRTSSQLIEMNDEDMEVVEGGGNGGRYAFWFFFPEKREIEAIAVVYKSGNAITLQGSNDTTNGMDGTWETAAFPSGKPVSVPADDTDAWRNGIVPVSFSTSYKTIRIAQELGGKNSSTYLFAIHIYGRKATGETPDDLLFCDASTGAEKTALMDWGDQPEGTTEIDSFKVKNASPDKIANNINLQLNHADFLMSWSPDGPWTATLDIATLGVGALSNTIYVRNKLGPPLLLLGPYAARVIASVGSWT